MKCIILAGGLGTRLSEETSSRPKPMVNIAGKPMLWHIMSIFAKQGFDDFVVATGYMNEKIEEWIETLDEGWKIQAINTGLDTQTGGRISKCISLFPGESRFFVTYGDGLANVNLDRLIKGHLNSGTLVTLTAVRPPARFGYLKLSENNSSALVERFGEKNQTDEGWINGGYFIMERGITEHITSDYNSFEVDVLPIIAEKRQLSAHLHNDFWKPMDTLREKNELEEMVNQGRSPWLQIHS